MGTSSAPRARSSPTIFDVARLAGVSHQTVSRVINNHTSVRETTRQRVQQAVAQLSYRPNAAARAMVGARSRNIGLITTGSSDYGPSSTVLGLLSAARSADYSISLATAVDTEPESVRAAIDLVLGQHVEAVVVVASRIRLLDALAGLSLRVPVLVIESSGRTSPSLSIDQYAGARTATEHLIGLGHRDIAHVAGPGDSMDATERLRGWRDTMAEHGLVAPRPLEGDWTPGSGYRIGNALTQRGSRFTALFVANDQMALGCVHALAGRGISVPDDVSVVGFDDIPEAEHFAPPLTTLRQDFRQLGTNILTTVLDVIEDRPVEPVLRLTPTLVVRRSTRRRA
ncbi:LacI family DNA-binding transcriptional regulator [Microlunatus antarcticus]|uniref:DNA-binding LacI/PurR family transcriptional regulator n=1 Tax=Microlunatus antarcticus TaxID=53388 RepID=A0A7W5JTC3_9ACTN|nr:LacI family DNA-binding transcriptional regulator [Microlunatus antarcticus]MBB3325981.1 DNA-binding LacI/PurR family transcriptional regulator [Microlunatus antarcticus]